MKFLIFTAILFQPLKVNVLPMKNILETVLTTNQFFLSTINGIYYPIRITTYLETSWLKLILFQIRNSLLKITGSPHWILKLIPRKWLLKWILVLMVQQWRISQLLETLWKCVTMKKFNHMPKILTNGNKFVIRSYYLNRALLQS